MCNICIVFTQEKCYIIREYGWYSDETAPDIDSYNAYQRGDIIKVGFIGAGKVGLSMAKYFKYKGIDISGFYIGQHSDNTKAEFLIFSQISDLVQNSDIIFVTVTDRAISEVWNRLTKCDIFNKFICHCSGSLSSEIFVNADKYNAYAASIHPILSFETFDVSISDISNAYFTIEGCKEAVELLQQILQTCGNKYYNIDSNNKHKYHCAACFASNFVIAVCQKAVDLLSECGFDKEDGLTALMPLITTNINNISAKGLSNSLTGPVERNDYTTIKNHLSTLNENDKQLYSSLTSILIDIAKEKHKDRDYSIMEELV